MTTDRVEAFSDGVFAIAITLLILEIPKIHEPSHLAKHLAENWREYITYLVSFLTIGIIWVNHHAARAVKRADRTLLFLNLLLLLFVSAIPYPTGLLGEHLHGEDGDVAAAVYAATLLCMGLSFLALNMHISRQRLHHDHVTPEAARRTIHRNMVRAVAVFYIFPFGVPDSPTG